MASTSGPPRRVMTARRVLMGVTRGPGASRVVLSRGRLASWLGVAEAAGAAHDSSLEHPIPSPCSPPHDPGDLRPRYSGPRRLEGVRDHGNLEGASIPTEAAP